MPGTELATAPWKRECDCLELAYMQGQAQYLAMAGPDKTRCGWVCTHSSEMTIRFTEAYIQVDSPLLSMWLSYTQHQQRHSAWVLSPSCICHSSRKGYDVYSIGLLGHLERPSTTGTQNQSKQMSRSPQPKDDHLKGGTSDWQSEFLITLNLRTNIQCIYRKLKNARNNLE